MYLSEIIVEEIKRLYENFCLIAMLMGLPIFFTIAFGFAYRENVVNNITLTVCDEEQSSLSKSLISMYDDSEKFKIVSYVETEEDMRQEIFNGRAKAALVIPKNFSRDIKSGTGTEDLFLVNSSNNVFGNSALSAVQEINKNFTVAIAQKLFEGQNLLPSAAMSAAYPIHLGVRIIGNPTNGYSPFMLSGLLLNGVQIGLMITIIPIFCEEFEKRKYCSLKEKILLPSKIFPYAIVSFAAYMISIILMINLFAIPMRGSWSELMILELAFIFFVCNVLLIFSAAAPNKVLALQAPLIYIMPGLLYSGLSFPNFVMNEYAEIISECMPMTYAGDSLRDILLVGYAPNFWHDFKSMIFGGLISMFVYTGIFCLKNWREERKNDFVKNFEA